MVIEMGDCECADGLVVGVVLLHAQTALACVEM